MKENDNMIEDEIKIVPTNNEIEVGIEEIKQVKPDKDSPILMFIQSCVRLKRMVNKSHKTELEPHLAMILYSIKYFIDYYDVELEIEEEHNHKLKNFLRVAILSHQDEFFFTDFKNDINPEEGNQIIDALGVKFYQTVLYYINYWFNAQKKMFTMEANVKKNTYVFKYRMMNVMELSSLHKQLEKSVEERKKEEDN